MKILVTGHKGFIGKHLVESLDTHEVIGVDVLDGNNDIKDIELDDSIDLVIHLAAFAGVRQSMGSPQLYWENNVVNSQNIFNQCNELKIPCIYASSSNAEEWWNNPYGMSKRAMEVAAASGYKNIGLRFTTVWGKGVRPNMLVSLIKRNKLVYYTNHIRDYIHVSDVVDAIIRIIDNIQRLETTVMNVGRGVPTFIRELVEKYYPRPNKLEWNQDGFSFETDDNLAKDTHAIRELGWTPTIDIMDVNLRDDGVI